MHPILRLYSHTLDTISKLPIGDPVVHQTNHKKDGGDGNTFALWAMRGMSVFEIADLNRGDGNGAGTAGDYTLGAVIVIVDSLEAAGQVAGDRYEYSGRMT